MAKVKFHESCPFHELTIFNASWLMAVFGAWMSKKCEFKCADLALALLFFDGVINSDEMLLAIKELLFGKIFFDSESYFVDVSSQEIGIRRVILSNYTIFILHQIVLRGFDSENLGLQLNEELQSLVQEHRIQLDTKKKPVEVLCEAAFDFFAMQLSGPVREWMSGAIKSRTLRPEAVARHKFNLVERMTFAPHQMRRPRLVLDDHYIRDVINLAVDNTGFKGSQTLRLKHLKDQLSLALNQFVHLSNVVTAKFVIYLCSKEQIKAPGTIKNHYLNTRDLIKSATRDFASFEEFIAQDWAVTLANYFAVNGEKKENIIAINYLLEMIGIPLKIKSKEHCSKIKNPKAMQYADFLSNFEIKKLQELILSAALTDSQKTQLRIMLDLLKIVPQRREDIATLRLKDVVGEKGASSIVISTQTTGTKKSVNSQRVIDLSEHDVDELLQFSEIKKQVFDNHKFGLFSRLEDPKNYTGGYDILAILSRAMKSVTGSNEISPHHFRSGLITSIAQKILSVEFSTQASADQLRLALYESFVFSGHGDLRTLIEYYFCNMEWVRREWIDHIGAIYFTPSPIFLSSISALNLETLRKYAANQNQLSNFLTKQLKRLKLSFSSQIVDLRDFVEKDIAQYSFENQPDGSNEDRQLVLIRYRCLCLCGLDQKVAAEFFYLSEHERKKNDGAFKLIKLAGEKAWHSEFTPAFVLESKYFHRLLTKLGLLGFSVEQTIGISQIFPSRIGEEWVLDAVKLSLFPADFFARIHHAGFDTIFSFSPALLKDEVTQIVEKHTPTHYQFLGERCFKRGIDAKVKFVFHADKRSAWPRRSKQATGLITLFLISFLSIKLGEIHV